MTPLQPIESETPGSPSFSAWIQANTRAITIGAVVVLIGAGGYWFYLKSAELKRMNAERGLTQAKQSIQAGNAALATNDLQRVATRYKGTPAGAQAAMLLAQLDFSQGKLADGLKALEPYETPSAGGINLSPIWSLAGDGQLMSGKPADAAAAYQKAADATKMPGERAQTLAKAARALMLAGKDNEARALWEKLANDPSAISVKHEAEIRLGELSATTARKS